MPKPSAPNATRIAGDSALMAPTAAPAAALASTSVFFSDSSSFVVKGIGWCPDVTTAMC